MIRTVASHLSGHGETLHRLFAAIARRGLTVFAQINPALGGRAGSDVVVGRRLAHEAGAEANVP